MSEAIRVYPLKKITTKFIVEKGYDDARAAKDLLWNSKFKEARVKARSEQATNMWSLIRAAEVELWIYMTDESEENRALAETAMKDTLDFVEFVKEKTAKPGFFSFGADANELGEMRPVLEAHAHAIEAFGTLGLAILEFRKRAFMAGGYHLRSSWKLFESAQNMQKHFPDDKVLIDTISFGLGFFALAISLLPSAYQWLAELIGFSADRDDGMKRLMEVYEAKGPSSIEAGLLVSMIRFFFLDDTEGAMALTKKLLEERPDSIYLLVSMAGMHKYRGQVLEAEKLQKRAYDLSADYPQLHLSTGYTLSDLYWMVGRYEDAVPLIENYLNGTRSERFRAFAGWKLGFALWMTDRKEEIASIYQKVIGEWSSESESYDRFSARKCREFFDKKGYSEVEESLYPAIWAAELLQWDLALSKANHAVSKASKDAVDELATAEYILGICQNGKENYDVGLVHLRNAIDMRPQRETWVVPYAHLAIAQAALKTEKLPMCEKSLSLAQGFGPFDFDGRHKMACKKLQEQIKTFKAKK